MKRRLVLIKRTLLSGLTLVLERIFSRDEDELDGYAAYVAGRRPSGPFER